MSTQSEESTKMSSDEIDYAFLTRNLSRVKCDDKLDGLSVFNAIDPAFTLDHVVARQLRGLVVNETEESIVFRGFPYCQDVNVSDSEKVNNLEIDFAQVKCFKAYEGALIRVFNYNNKWYVSTHRKLDAYRSKWSSPDSFGKMFDDALQYNYHNNSIFKNIIVSMKTENTEKDETVTTHFLNSLNKNNTYLFLVLNSSYNRLVCKAPANPSVYHVGTFINKTDLTFDYDINLPVPELLKFTCMSELIEYVNNVDPYNSQGVIIFDGNHTQYKIMNSSYVELFDLRNNEPSIKYRYLQLRKTDKKDKFIDLYSDMQKVFEGVELSLKKVASRIYKMYVDKFILKIFVFAPKDEYYVMTQCHSWHKENRETNKIRIEKVTEILESMTPYSLYQMTKRHVSDKVYQPRTKQTNDSTKNVQ